MTPEAIEGGGRMRARIRWSIVPIAGIALVLAGCGGSGSEGDGGSDPARVEKVAGTDQQRVVLSGDAAKRLGVETAPVRAVSGAVDKVEIPYSAVLYDPDGATWTYTSPSPHAYVRSDVVVASIVGDRALLSEGPRPGTKVVTVGADEIWGVEYGEIEED